jgi:hypothetical protein
MDRYAHQCPNVRHFRHTDFLPSEILDDRTLMVMEMRPGDGIAHLEAGSGVGEIPDGGLYEPWHDALLLRFLAARRPAARLAALTTYAAPDAEANPKICDFL